MNVSVMWRGRGGGELSYFAEYYILSTSYFPNSSIKSVAFSIIVFIIDSNQDSKL